MNEEMHISKFALTPQEQQHLQRILDWQDASAKCGMVFGPSIECPICHAMNNPNNAYCHQCARKL